MKANQTTKLSSIQLNYEAQDFKQGKLGTRTMKTFMNSRYNKFITPSYFYTNNSFPNKVSTKTPNINGNLKNSKAKHIVYS